MNGKELEDIFEHKLYLWCKVAMASELDDHFPNLRSFPSGLAHRFMNWMQQLSKVECRGAAMAIVKRWRVRGVELAGESLDDVELACIDRWIEKARNPTQYEMVVQGDIQSGVLRRVSRKKIAAILRHELSPTLGEDSSEIGEGAWRYQFDHNDWIISTTIDTNGRSQQLIYSHSIYNKPLNFYKKNISLLSYLGISSQTSWENLTDSNFNNAIKCIENTCGKFMDFTKDFVKSLPV